jgi:hypothetical protein
LERACGVFGQSEFASVLAAVAEALRGAGLRWYVFGAQAVVAYGRPRLTADLDITVVAELDQVPHLVASLGAAGLALRAW